MNHLLRRDFLTTTASGLGALALGSLLNGDGLLAGDSNSGNPRAPHFAPRAKRCIFVFLAGAPSQIDLLDPKPELVRRDGENRLSRSVTSAADFPDRSMVVSVISVSRPEKARIVSSS